MWARRHLERAAVALPHGQTQESETGIAQACSPEHESDALALALELNSVRAARRLTSSLTAFEGRAQDVLALCRLFHSPRRRVDSPVEVLGAEFDDTLLPLVMDRGSASTPRFIRTLPSRMVYTAAGQDRSRRAYRRGTHARPGRRDP